MGSDRDQTVRPCERVLVVEDDADMRETMKDVLEMGGANVAVAPSRAEANRILASGFEPSVIVLDVRLGRGDRGDDYAHELRRSHARTPIVLMSGDLHELRRIDEAVGATLSKPFDIDRLFEILSDMCSGGRASGSVPVD